MKFKLSKTKHWKSRDGIKIPSMGSQERAAYEKAFFNQVAQVFANGDKKRLKQIVIPTESASGSNMAVNKDRLSLYTRMLRGGDDVPPVVVAPNGPNTYRLIDGNHRQAAAQAAGIGKIRAYLLQPAQPAGQNKKVKKAELGYAGLNKNEKPFVKINPEHGKMIADAYESMPHTPDHPETKAAYQALINETKEQYKNLLAGGLKISKMRPDMQNPYPTSKHLHADLENNNHMWYYPTETGYGPEGSSQSLNHPMLQPTEFKDPEGKPMLANDVFRVVHDTIHNKLKNGFGPKGEHESYLEHKKTYSPLAQKALATETMGQNSTVNFGTHGEHNRKNPSQTIYAEQKAGLLPEHIINGNWHQ